MPIFLEIMFYVLPILLGAQRSELDEGPNCLIDWRQISVKTFSYISYLADALMEYFVEGSAPLRLWK